MIKKLIATKLCIAVLFMTGCASIPQLGNQTITTFVSFGTTEGLKYGIKESARRTAVANYVSVYAGALRSISGTPTMAELIAAINKFVPDSVRAAYPELETVVTPIIASVYNWAYEKWGTDHAKIYAVLNAIAAGLEQGAAPYVSK